MIQSVDRALRILEILKENPKGLGVTELSHRVDVAKSTIHRLLASLEKQHYVKQNESDSTYKLGLKFIEMNQIVTENLDIVEIAHPILEKLSHSVGEISHLVMLDHDQIVYIDKVEVNSTIRIYSQIGRRAPLYCTGVGKALLAHFTSEQLDTYLLKNPLKKYTEYTFIEKQSLLGELKNIRESGYSMDNEEHELGVRCVAVPVVNHKNQVLYGISVTGPISRMSDQRVEELIPKVQAAANEISNYLGYSR